MPNEIMNKDNYLYSKQFLKRKKIIPDDKLIQIISDYVDLNNHRVFYCSF